MVVILTIPLYSRAAGSEHRRDNAVAGPVTARVLAVIDGDTLAVSARIWIGQTIETRVRPPGVDTPELRGDCDGERELAAATRDFVMARIAGGDVVLWDVRNDKFGGRAYDGGARQPWC